ncbi:hypothetical protein [Hominenteromicrobium sp.]
MKDNRPQGSSCGRFIFLLHDFFSRAKRLSPPRFFNAALCAGGKRQACKLQKGAEVIRALFYPVEVQSRYSAASV